MPGERLSDDELTGWFGVSRTPVREAIARLVAEGLEEGRRRGLERQQLAAYRDPLDAYRVLTAGLENPLFTDAERSDRGRAKFHAASPDVTIDWAPAIAQAGVLAKL